ncbi:hypothetical protein [Synechococcus sp. M16CYN]|uniref:hypothetical protein n=1 Tax=Synechococcus sp. M16CYN TaxID=3103139 RepID=UPI00333E64F1
MAQRHSPHETHNLYGIITRLGLQHQVAAQSRQPPIMLTMGKLLTHRFVLCN